MAGKWAKNYFTPHEARPDVTSLNYHPTLLQPETSGSAAVLHVFSVSEQT